MKIIMTIASVLMAAGIANAQPDTPATPPSSAPPAAETTANPAAKKMSKKEAKAACKSEGKKGKDLKECVKQKTM